MYDAQGMLRAGCVVEGYGWRQPDDYVQLYNKRCHLTGPQHRSARLGEGTHNLWESGLEGKLVKMEMPPKRWRVTLYSERDGKGAASPVYTSTVCFQRRGWPVGLEAFGGGERRRREGFGSRFRPPPPRPPTPTPSRVVNTQQLADAQARAAALTRARLTAGTAAVEARRSTPASIDAGRFAPMPATVRAPTWGEMAKSIKIEKF
jgi:hypothetical protein